ncbi:MAG: HAD-IIIC family phosphatase [Candidatus Sulfotelmatobacter sp.]
MTAGANGNGSDGGLRQVLLAGDTTLDPLARLLERNSDAPKLRCSAAPYGQVFQILLDGSHPAWANKPDDLLVWTAPQLTLPSVGRLMRFEFVSHDEALREAEQFADAVLQAASRVSLVLAPTWILPSRERWIQTLTCKHGAGLANLLARANLVLAEKFAAQSNIILLDANYWQTSLGRPAHDPRMYAVAKILYSQPMLEKAAAEIKSVLRGALGLGKKVIVCDLDNTLWGGVVGDEGAHAIKLGAPDPVGECFHAFQSALKGLRARGIVLAICSKNDEKFALSVIDDHPAMALRKSDFVAWRINWKNKAENLASLAEELNLGLDSFVFLDDSPQEREQVRQMLPQVFTPDLPVSPADLAPFISSLDCFETPALGREDFHRTEMYQAERGRREVVEMRGGVETWLRSLQIEVRVTRLQKDNLARAAQLLNKTNQFNLALRRMDEQTFWNWAGERGNSAYVFNVSDRFGDFGLTGMVTVSREGRDAQIVDFVMSCRVMGKKVEEALLGYVFTQALADGAVRVKAPAFEGPRNAPAREFFAAKYLSGDDAVIDPERVAVPSAVTLKEESLAPA